MNLDLDGICKLRNSKHRIYVYVLIAILVFDYLLFPLPILAKEINNKPTFQKVRMPSDFKSDSANFRENLVENDNSAPNLAKDKEIQVILNHGYHSMTAYTSEVAQTDSDPCTTANGYNVCKAGKEDTIAANFLKFGTKVQIPELFGDRVFVVRDRMNSRYPERVDVWMKSKPDAIKFGVKYAKIQVVK